MIPAQVILLVGNIASILAIIEGNKALAVTIQADANQAAIDVTNWKTGSDVTIIIDAIELLRTCINVIPQIGPYFLVVQLGLIAVESLLALIPAPSAGPAFVVATPMPNTPATVHNA